MNHEVDPEHKFVSIASFKRNFYNNSFDKFLQIYLYRHVMISLYRSSLLCITMYRCSSELAALCKCLSFFSITVLNCTVLT